MCLPETREQLLLSSPSLVDGGSSGIRELLRQSSPSPFDSPCSECGPTVSQFMGLGFDLDTPRSRVISECEIIQRGSSGIREPLRRSSPSPFDSPCCVCGPTVSHFMGLRFDPDPPGQESYPSAKYYSVGLRGYGSCFGSHLLLRSTPHALNAGLSYLRSWDSDVILTPPGQESYQFAK